MEQIPSSMRLRCKKNENTDKVVCKKEDEELMNRTKTEKKQSKQSTADSVVCIFIILFSTFVILHRSKTISTDVLFDFKVNP